jgi:hypothetical protein
VVARPRRQDEWVLSLYRTMQTAIGQQLKTEYEPPRKLTPKLIVLVTAMDKPREDRE